MTNKIITLNKEQQTEENKTHKLTIISQGKKNDADVLIFKKKEEIRNAKKPLKQKLPLNNFKIAA